MRVVCIICWNELKVLMEGITMGNEKKDMTLFEFVGIVG